MTAGMMKNADENIPFHVGLQGHLNSHSTSFSSPMRIKPKATFDARGLFLNVSVNLELHCFLDPILEYMASFSQLKYAPDSPTSTYSLLIGNQQEISL